MIEKDVVIIGGGPAGLTAGIYHKRARLDTILIEKLAVGGQIILTDIIENYPGFPEPITGMELANRMKDQAKNFGLEIISDEVLEIKKKDEKFIVKTWGEEFSCKGIVIASGSQPRKLNIPGEAKFTGRGVSSCATCDGPFFKDKKVVVIGGGDTAIEEGLYLTKHASKVYIMHRRDKLRATKILQERAFKNDKIEFIWNGLPQSFEGENKIEKMIYKNKLTDKENELVIDGIFIFVGITPNNDFIKKSDMGLKLDEKGYAIVDKDLKTNIDGIYGAGDIIKKSLYQVVTAAGDGAQAAFNLQKYIEEKYNE